MNTYDTGLPKDPPDCLAKNSGGTPNCFWKLRSPGPLYNGTIDSLIPASGPLCPACSRIVGQVLKRYMRYSIAKE